MIITEWIINLGRYMLLMKRVFTKPDRWSLFGRQFVNETYGLVIDSIGIVCLISVFIGAVCCIQIQMNLFSPLLPRFTLGATTREIIVLEFSYFRARWVLTLLPRSERCASPSRLMHLTLWVSIRPTILSCQRYAPWCCSCRFW